MQQVFLKTAKTDRKQLEVVRDVAKKSIDKWCMQLSQKMSWMH